MNFTWIGVSTYTSRENRHIYLYSYRKLTNKIDSSCFNRKFAATLNICRWYILNHVSDETCKWTLWTVEMNEREKHRERKRDEER